MADDDTALDGAASGGIQRLSKRLYDALVRDMVAQTVVDWRLASKRRRAAADGEVCQFCGQARCSLFPVACAGDVSKAPSSASQDAGAKSAPAGSSGSVSPNSGATSVATTAGSQAGKLDLYAQNPLFECVVCSRQVSSNRYAVHLAKCLGIGSSGKAASAARKQALSARNSPTPNAAPDTSSLLLSTPRVQAALEARKRNRAPDGHLLKPNGKRGEAAGRGGRGRQKKTVHSITSRAGSSAVFAASPLNPNVASARASPAPSGAESVKSQERVRPKLKTSSMPTDMVVAADKKPVPGTGSTNGFARPSPSKPMLSGATQARLGSPDSQRSSSVMSQDSESGEDSDHGLWDSGSDDGSNPVASQLSAHPDHALSGVGDDDDADNASDISDDSILDN